MTATATATSDLSVDAGRRRAAIVAGTIGNVLEWFDFAVYGYFVGTISKLFFPAGDPIVSILLTFAVFGVGFVMRPVGSILFGIYGDRYGRRKALSAVIFLMAFSTLAIGLLPTYQQVGVLAPLLLVVIRLIQGLSAGGEWGGSTAYLVEFAGEGKRGFIGSWQQVSVGGGFLLGSLMAALLNASLTPEALMSWGWRVPFILGLLVGLLGAYLRWGLDDTPAYTKIQERGEVARSPLAEALTSYPRETLTAFGLTLHNTVAYYIALIYMTSYMSAVAKIPQPTAVWIGTTCLAVFVFLIPFMGALSDRVGRKPLLIASCVGYAVLGDPLFLLASSGDVTNAFIAQLAMVVMLSPYAGACPATYSELFPTRIRYTALSIGYNTAVAIFGGFAPFIATFLIRETGNNLSPSFYVITASVITFLILLRVKETAFSPLK